MSHTTSSARITGPVHYSGEGGHDALIPVGPCLVERLDGGSVHIVWGENGDKTASLSFQALEAAEDNGHLIVID